MHDECNKDGHEELVRKKLLETKDNEAMATSDAVDLTAELLESKGYLPEEIQTNPFVEFESEKGIERAKTDFIVSVSGEPFVSIRCLMALESRERHVLAFARVAKSPPVPFCAITDGLSIHFIDTSSGETLSTTLDDFPNRDKASQLMKSGKPLELGTEKLKRERMVLMAFESTLCPTTLPPKEDK